MPELPEVETTRRGVAPHLEGRKVTQVLVREPRLRWPIPQTLAEQLTGQTLRQVSRRGKYLLFGFPRGTLIVHLGMSGSLRIVTRDTAPQKHDHFDLLMSGGKCLRLRDPRRFGAVLWTDAPPQAHPLLAHLGPEPLDEGFDGDYLYQQGRHRKVSIKQLIMDSKIVVGVGNIYANESLFRAGIHPARASNRISAPRYERLVAEIKSVLLAAIVQGGTTLRDFQREDGQPGYFAQELQVYGKAGEPCPVCGTTLKGTTLGQRSTTHCPRCQR
ncbi:MAG: bifunctional DNA-formamidopyrimidine glycosylase/DNA-(apurinic or apyrimidinic site) lyase [Candidatus Thiodiazotropha sp.]